MSKRISKAGNIKYALSGDDSFIASVEPGETFVVECAINANDGTIRHLGQQLTEADVTMPFVNGATGPIEVRGAKPGDMLRLEIVGMELDKLGFTALWPGIGMFPDWVRRKEFGIQTRVVEVKDGHVHWNEHLKLPVKPMIGVAGVAPVHGAVLTVDNGPHGGNMDVQEITTGNSIFFRVNKDGAHLFLGDCHAIQGDGECNGMGAIEIAANLTVKVSLAKAPARLTHPRIETATHICTLGCARPLEDAMRIAFEEMVYWMEDDWKIPAAEGYMLLGQVAEARCTQVVNPKYTYICKVERSLLERYHG
ncbi:acetamidase/formamidase family protein [Bradyrhizobium japonicum]|uniref:acetamidase/formamidase family protein n=1 Tax=Bradyrhizobium japonicum TaxID=375 RepID=UPI001BA5701E|nr:acetamidase/formamidase family protein [Bradyrhizobium japonicum]MBR0989236.1 acetamidase/formamidase family protein [Bradyrhizobium japonicum]